MFYLYLDESGDLGFDFISKKPSKYFNVTIMVVKGVVNRKNLVYGVKRTLKHKINFRKKEKEFMFNELKGNATKIEIKKYFYEKIKDIDFKVYSLTINKINVYRKFCSNMPPDKDCLYNWMARLVLDQVSFDQAKEGILFIIDKSKRRREIEDFNNYMKSYLQTRVDPSISIDIRHKDSITDYCLSAVDLFAWGVFRKYELDDIEWFNCFKKKVVYEELFLA